MITYIATDSNKPMFGNLIPFLLGFALLAGGGLSFALHAMYVGHHHTFGTTREVPWGLLVTPYFFFACMSTGLCIISSLGQVFQVESFKSLVPRTVFMAVITMATGLMCITLELENPWRVGLYAMLSPSPSSNIWWKSTIYSFYLMFMVFNFLSLVLHKEKQARIFATIALVMVLMGILNMNSDMSLLGTRGFWSENYMPIYFVTVSTLTGCATLLLFGWLSKINGGQQDSEERRVTTKAVSRLFMILLCGLLYFSGVKVLGGFFPHATQNPEAMFLLVQGNLSFNFWVAEVGLAVLLPLLIILGMKGKGEVWPAIAGLSCLVGCFVLYYHLVIAGQLIPHYYQYHVVGLPEYYSYSPSLHEIMVSAGAVFFFLAAFVVGEMVFKKISFK